MYITYQQSEHIVTSAVDKKTGKILRGIHSESSYLNGVCALGNKLVIAHELNISAYHVHVYDNEKFFKTFQMNTNNCRSPIIIASLDYFIFLRKQNNCIQLVVSNIYNLELNQKVVNLNGIKDVIYNIVWISNSVNEEDSSGYLFVTCRDSKPWKPLVYEIDLASVENGDTLDPLNIPFNFRKKYDCIYFYTAAGTDSVLCGLRQGCDYNLALLKMNFC
ncbi:uncharacterized protein LOC142351765 isoform X2 [Convolutriloba macropyga]